MDNSGGSEKSITVVGFGRRLLAVIYDAILLGFVSIMLAFVVALIGLVVGMFNPDSGDRMAMIITGSLVVLSIFYYIYFWSKNGMTVGKSLAGVKIVKTDGSGLSTGDAFLRYIGYIISGLVASLGFLWVAFDGRRQGWHDKIAKTYVIRSHQAFSEADQVRFVQSDPGKAWLWVVLWIIVGLATPTGFWFGVRGLGVVMNALLNSLFGT